MKKILIANDLPGIGKVALAPTIPIFACCQIETMLLPTVLLSSHTGGFKNIAIAEQTEFMKQSLKQWQELELNPDAVLTGYFRSRNIFSRMALLRKQRKMIFQSVHL